MSAKYQDVKLPREQSCSEFVRNSSKALPKHAAKTETETEQNRDRERGLELSHQNISHTDFWMKWLESVNQYSDGTTTRTVLRMYSSW